MQIEIQQIILFKRYNRKKIVTTKIQRRTQRTLSSV